MENQMNDTLTTDPDAVLGGLRIVDCDAHFSEPPDLWTSRVPDSMKARMPVMKTLDDGVTAWYAVLRPDVGARQRDGGGL